MAHHTAGPSKSRSKTPSLNVIKEGRKDIPGPLSQLYLGYDALIDLKEGEKPTIHLVSTGRANHAGPGGPFRNVPKDSGNAYLAGLEVENIGNNALYKDMVHLHRVACAAVLDHINKDARWYLFHKTWAPGRKPDIAGLEVNANRAAIQKLLNNGPQGDDMPGPLDWSPAEKEVIRSIVHDSDVQPGTGKRSLANKVLDIEKTVNKILAKLEEK